MCEIAEESAEKPLAFDLAGLDEALRARLTDRQYWIWYYRYCGEKRNSTIAAILRVSLSTIEKELHTIRTVREELCKTAIAENQRTDIPVAHGHKLGLASNWTETVGTRLGDGRRCRVPL